MRITLKQTLSMVPIVLIMPVVKLHFSSVMKNYVRVPAKKS